MYLNNSTVKILCILALLTGFISSPLPVLSQVENHLILKKNGYLNKHHYLTGDPVIIIREGNDYPEEAYIQGIGTDYIVLTGQEIPINKITHLWRFRSGFNFRSSGKALLIAAPGYLVIGAINELLRHRNGGLTLKDMAPGGSSLIVAGSLLTAGLILPAFQIRKYPLGKKFTLRIVQSDPALNR